MLKQKLSLQNKGFWVETVKAGHGSGSQGGTEMLRCGTRMRESHRVLLDRIYHQWSESHM